MKHTEKMTISKSVTLVVVTLVFGIALVSCAAKDGTSLNRKRRSFEMVLFKPSSQLCCLPSSRNEGYPRKATLPLILSGKSSIVANAARDP